MATIDSAKTTVRAYIQANGAQEITGDVLQGVLIDMLDAVDDVKVDVEEGKGLSTNDFTDAYQAQVDTNTSDIASLSSEVSTLSSEVAEMTVEVEAATALATAAAATANEAAETATTAASSASSAASIAESAASSAESAATSATEAAETATEAASTLTTQVESAISSMESTVSSAVSSMESTVSSAVSSMESEVSEAVEQAQSDVATAVSDAESATESATEAASEASAAAASIDNGYIQGLVSGSIIGSLGGGVSESFTSEVLSGIGKGSASLKAVRGKSMVYNQLVPTSSLASTQTVSGVTFTNNGDGSITISGTAEATINLVVASGLGLELGVGRKVIIPQPSGASSDFYARTSTGGAYSYSQVSGICTLTESTISGVYINIASGTSVSTTFYPQVIDLTLTGMAGSITTIDAFKALYPRPYYAYNQGEVVSNLATGLQSVSRNIWDEEWENGYYSTSGVYTEDSSYICSANLISILPETDYYIKVSASTTICYYDAEGSFVSTVTDITGSFTTPSGVAYMTFYLAGTSYEHDICINVSDTTFNGNYVPYWSNTLTLPLGTMTGKLNGSGDSVVVNADGFHGNDSVYDLLVIKNGWAVAVIKRMAVEDLGNLTWTMSDSTHFRTAGVSDRAGGSNLFSSSFVVVGTVAGWGIFTADNYPDVGIYYKSSIQTIFGICTSTEYSSASDFATAMSGQYLYYELATPLVYTLDEPFLVQFPCENGGSLSRLPLDTEDSVLAPFDADILYPQVLINGTSDTNLLDALVTAGIISSYTRTWDEDTQSYEYTLSV